MCEFLPLQTECAAASDILKPAFLSPWAEPYKRSGTCQAICLARSTSFDLHRVIGKSAIAAGDAVDRFVDAFQRPDHRFHDRKVDHPTFNHGGDLHAFRSSEPDRADQFHL